MHWMQLFYQSSSIILRARCLARRCTLVNNDHRHLSPTATRGRDNYSFSCEQLYCYRYCADWGHAIINIHVTSWPMFTILITPGQCPPVGSFWCANVIYAAYDFKEIVENSIFRPNSAPGTKPRTTIKRNGGWRKQMIRLLNFCKVIWN